MVVHCIFHHAFALAQISSLKLALLCYLQDPLSFCTRYTICLPVTSLFPSRFCSLHFLHTTAPESKLSTRKKRPSIPYILSLTTTFPLVCSSQNQTVGPLILQIHLSDKKFSLSNHLGYAAHMKSQRVCMFKTSVDSTLLTKLAD